MKKIILSIAALLLSFVLWRFISHPFVPKIKIGSAEFSVEVAVTEPQKQRGLGGRTSLANDHGMLFVYDHAEGYNFWMRDMHFPLDFIWINGKTVVDITRNVPPPVQLQAPMIVKPKIPADKILELNAGTAAKYGIQIGDAVDFLDR